MKLNQRIKAARESKGWRQEDLAKSSGVSIQSIKRYESSLKSNITIDNSRKIAAALGVDIEFFVSKGFVDENEDNDIINIPFLKDNIASAGFGVINYDTDISYIPVSKKNLIEVCKTTNFKDLFILQCSGDSMSPTIDDGDYLLVQKNQDIREGSIYVVEYDGGIFVKRIHKYPKIRLLSDNKDYLPIEISDMESIRVIAKVIISFKIFFFN